MLPDFVIPERLCRWGRCAVCGCVLVCPVCNERVIACVCRAMSVWFCVICERQVCPVKPEWSVALDIANWGIFCVVWLFVCLKVSVLTFVCWRVSGVLFVCLIVPVSLLTSSVFVNSVCLNSPSFYQYVRVFLYLLTSDLIVADV